MIRSIYMLILVLVVSGCGTTQKSKKVLPPDSRVPGAINNTNSKSIFFGAYHDYLVMNNDKALSGALLYIQKEPKDDAGFYLLSKIYIMKADSVNSLKSLEKARALDKNNRWYNEVLGKAYLSYNEYQKALDIYQNIDKSEPRSNETLLGLYQAYYGLKQYKNCLQVLDQIASLQGENPAIIAQRYLVLTDKKDYKSAENTLLDGIKKFPDNAQLLFALNDYYSATKQREKLIPILKTLISKSEDNGNAKLLLSDVFLRNGKLDSAEIILKEVFKDLDIDISTKQLFLMDNYVDNKFIPTSLVIELSNIVLKVNPNNSFFNLLLGNIYDKSSDITKALEYYKLGLKGANNKKEALYRIVFLEYQGAKSEPKDYDSLVKYASQALELYPSENDMYYFQAMGFLKTHQYEDCINAINNGIIYITDNKDRADFYSIKAEALFGLKRFEEGEKTYREAIKSTKDNNYLKVNLGLILAKNNLHLSEASTLLDEVLKNDPNSPTALYAKGFVYFRQEAYEQAKAIFKGLLATNPNDASIWNLMGDIDYKLGKIDDAVACWKKAKELKLNSKVLEKKIEDKQYYDEIF